MAPNYTMAAKRHFNDASLLEGQGRFANTSHLAGVAAECALKSILFGFGKLTLKDGKPAAQKHITHIDKFWREFQSSASGPSSAQLARLFAGANPFSDWHVNHRYEEDATVTEAMARAHLGAAKDVMKVFEDAVIRGEAQ